MAYQRLDITDLQTILTAAQVSHIEDGIIQNESDIADNAKNISTNTANIAANASNIATNTENIRSNTENISTINSDLSDKNNLISTSVFTQDSVGVSADDYTSGTINISRSGYTALGVVGWSIVNASSSGINSSRCYMTNIWLSATNTVTYQVSNRNSSNDANVMIRVVVLYSKN